MLAGPEYWNGVDHNEQPSMVFIGDGGDQDDIEASEGCVQILHVTDLLLHMKQINAHVQRYRQAQASAVEPDSCEYVIFHCRYVPDWIECQYCCERQVR
jgi:hypothetical protein